MAVDFALSGRGVRQGLSALLGSWARSQKLEVDEAVAFAQGGRRAFVFAGGLAIRGFSVEQTGGFFTGQVHARIHACASSADWQLLFSFLAFMAARGAHVEDDGGLELSPGALTAEEATRRWRFGFRRALRVLQLVLHERAEPRVWLPNARFPLCIDAHQMPEGELADDALHALEKVFVGGANGYARIPRDAATPEVDATLTGDLDLIVIPEPAVGTETALGHPTWPVVTRIVPSLVEHVRGTPPRYHLHNIELGPPHDEHLRQALIHDGSQPLRLRS